MTDTTRQSVLFPSLFRKPLHMAFDDPATSSDGGAVLLKAVDQALGLTPALAAAFRDNRQGAKVRHSTAELLGQRIYGLALGYPDANDAGRMGADPMMRLLIDRDSRTGADLASQPTLSRFENSASNTDIYRMGTTLAETVVAFHKKRLRRRNVKKITIDLDPTDTPNHGEQQELSFFNGHYGHYCYLPMLGFLSFNDEPDQYLFAAVLRSGVASAKDGARGVLRRILAILRRSFPKAKILVRLDGGFAGPEMLEFLDTSKVGYVVAMPGNKVLDKRAEDLMAIVRRLSVRTGTSAALFGETRYAAGSWNNKERRVIDKAEVVRFPGRDPRDNQRFVVTNLRHDPERVYEVYRMRSESENRIKEMQHGLRLDLTSCMTFKANQMRVLMTAAAYVLMQTLRSRLSHTSLARKQVESLRLMLLKIGAKVTTSVRRIVIRMAQNHPWRDEWYRGDDRPRPASGAGSPPPMEIAKRSCFVLDPRRDGEGATRPRVVASPACRPSASKSLSGAIGSSAVNRGVGSPYPPVFAPADGWATIPVVAELKIPNVETDASTLNAASPADLDAEETREWLESLDSVLAADGPERAHYLIERLVERARRSGVYLPYRANTAYINTIPTGKEPRYPGDRAIERRLEAFIRWNAMAMVVQANRRSTEYGGHIASYASSATMYEVGFNHFWRAATPTQAGDLVFMQGHSSPGIYARAYLEGRLSDEQLSNFRRETGGKGLSSYPHPWLMPDFWQFPTVSMGLGPLMAMYQARFLRYLEHRGLVAPTDRKVWAFCGDGEMDEPESMGALTMPVREKLDNLVFVINCNLQRLDGPVRGNGKIIQELEAAFLGAGWNVIKVVWGSRWDPLLARDTTGILQRVMEESVDGEYQSYKAKGGAYTREHFFGKHPVLKEMVANLSDEEIWHLNRGGHDARKVHAAYDSAMKTTGRPTVILCKTVKGFGLGKTAEGQMGAHQQKKFDVEALREIRDRFHIPVSDEDLVHLPFRKPAEDSEEMRYLRARREALGGYLPARDSSPKTLPIPPLSAFSSILEGTGEREISTTMAFVRILSVLLKDPNLGKHIVPIVPDEARTFGMEGLFRQIGIYSSVGQLYNPVDADALMPYREDKKGQMLEEGINEAGATCSWIAAATSAANHGIGMVPFYIFYSMFGFQRVGDFLWAAGDMRSRGFLLGATAGRTTLAGEGLQHQDGHSQLVAATIPNCRAYDPAYAYELAVILQDGLRRMYVDCESVFYYVTVMNENYAQPAMPVGVERGIVSGGYPVRSGAKGTHRATLLGSGTILREVLAAADILERDYDVAADVLSITSFSELRREALDNERFNLLHPDAQSRSPYVSELLGDRQAPVIAATDYVRSVPDQIRQWVPGHYVTLGTDGFGRSDARAELRRHFEVDRQFIVLATLRALADMGKIEDATVAAAVEKLGIDPEKRDPLCG